MVSAKLLLIQSICNSLTLLKLLVSFHSINHLWFFQPWLSQGYPFLFLFYFWHPSLPRNKFSSSSHIHQDSDVDILFFPLPILFLDLSKLRHLYADSSTSVFLQDETNFKFCRGTECAFDKITVELSLHSPSSLETSEVSNYSSHQIMPSGRCFAAEHHQKFASHSSWASLARRKLCYFYFTN